MTTHRSDFGLMRLFAPMAVAYCLVFLAGLVFAGLQVWIRFSPPLLPPPGEDLPKIFFYLVKYIHIHIFAIPLLGIVLGAFFILITRAGERSKMLLPALLQALVALELTALWLRWFVSPVFEPLIHVAGGTMLSLFGYIAVRVIFDGFVLLTGIKSSSPTARESE